MGIDTAAQNRANDVERAFDSRSLAVTGGKRREDLAEAGAATIKERSDSIVEAFEGVQDILEGLSLVEFAALAAALVAWGLEKIGAASVFTKAGIAIKFIGLIAKALPIVGKVIVFVAAAAAIFGLAFMKLIEALHYRVTFYTATYDYVPDVSEA